MSRPLVIFADDDPAIHHQATIEDRSSHLIHRLKGAQVVYVSNSKELIDKLIENLNSNDPPSSIIVILDLGFPKREDGLNALNLIKLNHDPRIRSIPVIIYSQSGDEADIFLSYQRCCNAYVKKDDHPYTFWDILQHIDENKFVSLPTQKSYPSIPSLSIKSDLSLSPIQPISK